MSAQLVHAIECLKQALKEYDAECRGIQLTANPGFISRVRDVLGADTPFIDTSTHRGVPKINDVPIKIIYNTYEGPKK